MDKINVLLIEDEPVLAAIVKESLEKRGFNLFIAVNGVEGWSMFKSMRPDICIIDVMMPRKDGFTLVREIRIIDQDIPLIFVTARTQIEDIIKGFELGADDYMKKPFSMEELIVRLKALVRRKTDKKSGMEVGEIAVGKFRFRHSELELIDGVRVSFLSQREADLLLMLLQHKNQLLERKIVLVKIWGDDNPYTARSMDVYITRLRKFLKSDPLIEITNTRGLGYTLTENL